MPRNTDFRVLHVDANTGRGRVILFGDRTQILGGSGLAAALFNEYGLLDAPAFDPRQPLIFAIGPLTGYYPLMSKVVAGFKSPYNEEYVESHAGGRLALSMRFAGYDAIMITGEARTLSCLVLGARSIELHDVHYLRGVEALASGKYFRRFGKRASGHRSMLRIGPAGENRVAYACINVDTYRHFGRLGSGAVMGAKKLKAIIVMGDSSLPLPAGKEYPKLYKDIFEQLTQTSMMHKYHDLGTPANMAVLNEIKALPWRNMQSTSSPLVTGVSGEAFAEQLLLRQTACSGCPVGCIHIGLLRRRFAGDHDYLYRQVSYDHETVFSEGAMLGMSSASSVLALLDETEKQGLDAISAGVALAWATEALERGLVSEKETIVRLEFDNVDVYRQALRHLGDPPNEFYRALGQGALAAAKIYGGEDFACVLGQEMAGYATGEVFFVSQALGFRASHLDSGGYSYDQKSKDKDAAKAVDFMVNDERKRVMLTCMVSCLFGREEYSEERLKEALAAIGMLDVADNLATATDAIRGERWKLKFRTGYDPERIVIPKRYKEIVTWKGPIDEGYINALQTRYAASIRELAGLPLPESGQAQG
jgi:aldehyde:ferredoxin oxidoreductase